MGVTDMSGNSAGVAEQAGAAWTYLFPRSFIPQGLLSTWPLSPAGQGTR